MLSLLEPLSENDAEVLYEAVNRIKDLSNDETHLFNLQQPVLDTIAMYAGSSFGNYTNLLRSFLSSEYDIHIPWPEPIINRSSFEDLREDSHRSLTPSIIIRPNPSSGCFVLESRPATQPQHFLIKIYSLSGDELYNAEYSGDQMICPDGFAPGAYFLTALGLETQYLYRQVLIVQP